MFFDILIYSNYNYFFIDIIFYKLIEKVYLVNGIVKKNVFLKIFLDIFFRL